MASHEEVFQRIYSEKVWGYDSDNEGGSGLGSHDKRIISNYIKDISDLIDSKELAAFTWLDLGCGDFNIGRHLAKLVNFYHGVDVVPEVVLRNKKLFRDANTKFSYCNIVVDNLPDADVCLIRQVFQHLSNNDILKVLPKLTKYKYIIFSDHQTAHNLLVDKNVDIITGAGIRLSLGSAVYLDSPPFSIPKHKISLISSIIVEPHNPEGGYVNTYLIENGKVHNSSPRNDVDILVTLATLKDARNWTYISKSILSNIDSRSYYLIVPDEACQLFQEITPSQFTILKDSQFIPSEIYSLAIDLFGNRSGWYIQQFIKIEASRILEGNEGIEDPTVLIWDSDTLPLKRLGFTNDDGSLSYYLASEYHPPYFQTLHSLLGLDRTHPKSFISQCFPCKQEWVISFCSEIQNKHNTHWMNAVLRTLEPNQGLSLFSEYESLGTYFLSKYSSQMKFNMNKKWFRYGSSLFGSVYIDQIKLECISKMGNAYDYVSFESWDSIPFDGLNIGCANVYIRQTQFSTKVLNVDILDLPQVDLVLDCDSEHWYLPSDSYNHIIANSILEHVDDPLSFLKEVDRILKVNGVLEFEVPFLGSYNHGTDITHKRGFTFDSFCFLYNSQNYLFRDSHLNPFKYSLLEFWRENVVNGTLYHEKMECPPERELKQDEWVTKCLTHEIPGSFGLVLQKENRQFLS